MKHTPMSIDPITLSGQYVRLEPLSMSHYDALWAIGQDAELWKWTPYQITTPDKMHAYIKAALDGREIGTALLHGDFELLDEQPLATNRRQRAVEDLITARGHAENLDDTLWV